MEKAFHLLAAFNKRSFELWGTINSPQGRQQQRFQPIPKQFLVFSPFFFNWKHNSWMLKTLWKKKKMLVTSIFSFSTTFSTHFKTNFSFWVRLILLSSMLSVWTSVKSCGLVTNLETTRDDKNKDISLRRFLWRYILSNSWSPGLENRRSLVRSPAQPIFFPKIDDSYCDRIHSSLTTVHCFEDGYVRKQPVACKNIVRSSGKNNSTQQKQRYMHWPQGHNWLMLKKRC